MAQVFQIWPDGFLQLRGFCKLRFQGLGEPFHLLLERIAVIFDFFRADIPSRCENVTWLPEPLK
jgi:hypothetical protein